MYIEAPRGRIFVPPPLLLYALHPPRRAFSRVGVHEISSPHQALSRCEREGRYLKGPAAGSLRDSVQKTFLGRLRAKFAQNEDHEKTTKSHVQIVTSNEKSSDL